MFYKGKFNAVDQKIFLFCFFSQIQGGHCYSVRDRFVKDSDHEENESNDEDIEDDFEDEETKDEFDKEGVKDNSYVTFRFTVLKLEWCTPDGRKFKYKWVQVDSLSDQALFVGDNSLVFFVFVKLQWMQS